MYRLSGGQWTNTLASLRGGDEGLRPIIPEGSFFPTSLRHVANVEKAAAKSKKLPRKRRIILSVHFICVHFLSNSIGIWFIVLQFIFDIPLFVSSLMWLTIIMLCLSAQKLSTGLWVLQVQDPLQSSFENRENSPGFEKRLFEEKNIFPLNNFAQYKKTK